MEKIVSKFLRSLKIPVSKSHIERLIVSHPDYPSLLSIADTFERLGISYNASRIRKEDLPQIKRPYLLPLPLAPTRLALIEKEQDLKFYRQAIEKWDGVILQARATRMITDPGANLAYKREKSFRLVCYSLALTVGFLMFLSLFYNANGMQLALFATSFSGAIISYFLVAKDLGITYSGIESFCNSHQNVSCDKVLKSEGAKFFGIIKFSDLAIAYFLSQLVLISIGVTLHTATYTIVAVLSFAAMLAISVVIFSIYYQAVVIRSWCKICLTLDTILSIQTVLLTLSFVHGVAISDINPITVFFGLSVFVIVTCSFLIFKKLLERNEILERALVTSNRIKNSLKVLTHIWQNEKPIDVSGLGDELKIGDEDAPIKIIMVGNLYCNPCKDQHEKISQLMARFPGKLSLTMRFVPGSELHLPDRSTLYVLQYWISNILGKANESANTESLIADWYKHMDLNKFKTKYFLNDTIDDATMELEENHMRWVWGAGVKVTPTFFINGRRLPKEYRIDDLWGLIPELAEYFTALTS